MSLTIKTLGRGRRVAAGSLIAVTALTLSACQNGTDSASSQSSSAAAPATSSASRAQGAPSTGGSPQSAGNAARPSSVAKPSAGTSGVPSASQANPSAMTASDRCTAENMSLRLGRTDVGAGNIRVPLVFTNKGKKACSLRGYPGVSLIQRDGSAVGTPASREGGAGGSVRLQPGQSAHAVLHTVNDGVSDIPCWKDSQIVFVYPPGSKESMTTNSGGLRVCGGTFTVTAVEVGVPS
ncbi:DUF4232 domain-containing protein [Streptomyces noursei]|uniref:DUF4232 domain-containing protein n=1 Tax=Streptomyces noursei TaxID=1971 RepID=UPI00081D2E28|nr:DUF4232 domain-containing protein [Streptomyces noursei]ANZ14405.1 serine/threonine protein kinase [Streptomyces noursei ATCC 11455]MCZ1019994.1 DUF4232 domain-containing protein [Streptomyces noursei]GGX37393.1 hypothetical protein GCM10010341_69110 [Streptomyces noursei]